MNYPLIFAENQQLETERLHLRPVTLADTDDLFEYASDEETTRFVFPKKKQEPVLRNILWGNL